MKRWQHACSVLILTTGLLPALAQSAPAGTVDGTTNLRAAPDTRAEISGRLPAGEPVILTGRDVAGRWVQVENSAGITGWLPVFALITEADILALPLVLEAEATPDETVQVEAFGRVNVRSAPTVTADVVGQLDGGELMQALARDSATNDWLLIALPDAPDVEGWVAYFTVGVEGDPNALPIVAVDAADAVVLPEALASARFNARLHTAPTLESPVIVVVPFEGQIEPIARTENGDWLYVRYGDSVGWGAARLFNLTRRRAEALPVYVPTAPSVIAPTAVPRNN